VTAKKKIKWNKNKDYNVCIYLYMYIKPMTYARVCFKKKLMAPNINYHKVRWGGGATS
jgi:hypothetical protein